MAIVPVQAAKDFVSYGQGERFLIGWWGDARSWSATRQSATVRLSLDAAIADLRAHGCERIVVIAHSGGTIVSAMTLAIRAGRDRGHPHHHGQAIELGAASPSNRDATTSCRSSRPCHGSPGRPA
jgi:hypothetical protein